MCIPDIMYESLIVWCKSNNEYLLSFDMEKQSVWDQTLCFHSEGAICGQYAIKLHIRAKFGI